MNMKFAPETDSAPAAIAVWHQPLAKEAVAGKLDPANAANIVSDELTSPQKRSIALAAAGCTTGALWLDIVSKRRHPVPLVLLGRLRIRGRRGLLDRFAACFPR